MTGSDWLSLTWQVLNDFNTKAQDIRADYEDESYKWGSILYKVRGHLLMMPAA
jgi:hypothetical protein